MSERLSTCLCAAGCWCVGGRGKGEGGVLSYDKEFTLSIV